MGEEREWEINIGFTGQIELGVIHEATKMDTKFMEDKSEWGEINDEEGRCE